MCDYSLMAVPNRLAQQGEELVAHRFPTGSLGLAAPADVKRAAQPRPMARRTIWQAIQQFFDPAAAPAVCAVCIPPGARLELSGIPVRLQKLWDVASTEEVEFTQISANVNTYRDALRLTSGRLVRLQDLWEGIQVRVLDLSAAEEPVWELESEML